MKEKQNNGFTLAELLIVVAIIGVLVAISIPIFTSQLKKARLATNQANARAAYAAAVAERLDANATGAAASYVYDVASAKITGTPGTNTGTANSGNIQAWTETTPFADAGTKTATSWEVCFDASDNVTFNATFPGA